nr:structural maintenance of chromosomes protein 6 [Quercus suber]
MRLSCILESCKGSFGDKHCVLAWLGPALASMAHKRSRRADDDGDNEIGIESASSSFRRTASAKRSRLAMAAANGGSVVSDDEDDDADRFEFTVSSGPSGRDYDTDEVDEGEELLATQIVEKNIRKHRDNIASESGIIEEVYCSNFMCHTKLRIKFGPLINFIVGHNGSGKSAVLTALTMCLGGKASSTNRGTSMKSMIKEGEDHAVLAVKIKNAGDGAYKPDLYGRSISVERHFSRTGASGFKIKGSEGKIITTKKSDLDDILDFFAFQLDNPINVLNQDMARQFLSNSTPSEKYKFFIRGTQLEVLDADYKVVEENIDNIEAKLRSRAEDNKILKAKADSAEQKKRFLEQAKSIREKIEETRRMHAWAQVEEVEEDLNRKLAEVRTAEENVNEKTDAAQDASGIHEGHQQAWEAAGRQYQQLKDDIEPVKEKHDAAKEKFEANKQEIITIKETERKIKGDLKMHKDNVKRHDREIEQEERRMAEAEGGDQAERVRELHDLRQAAEEAKREQTEHDALFRELDRKKIEAGEAQAEAKPRLENATQALTHAQSQLNELQRSEGRPLDPYRPQMTQLVKAINAETRWREKPVGPIGTYIRLLKMEWSSVIETVFGGVLNGFCCTNMEDRRILESIMKRVKCEVSIYKGDSVRISVNEPREDLVTILRVLHVESDLIRNQIIINQSVENTVLTRSTEEAIKLIQNQEPRVKVAICASEHGGGARYALTSSGNAAGGPVKAWQGQARMKADREDQLRLQREKVTRAASEKQDAEQHHKAATDQVKAAKQALERHKRVKGDLIVKVQRADDAIDELQNVIESNQPQDGKLQELRRLRGESQEECDHTSASYRDWIDAKDKLDDAAKPLKAAMDETSGDLELAIARADKKELRMSQLNEVRETALRKKNEALAKVETAKKEVQERVHAAEQLRQTITEEFIPAAQQICARVEVAAGMTPNILDKRLEKFETDLRHQERQAGGTEEELTLAWQEAKSRYLDSVAQTEEMEKFQKLQKESLNYRQERWHKFRKCISLRTRSTFSYLLSERNFRGRVIIDHKNKLLDIKVEPDLSKESDAGRATKTLSGGEKSFATICLLLSVWEAMGSPIRCLDEFDVFMDSVNRATSMGMMIQAARRSVGRQFVLITPQAMGNVELGDDVKVHKMSDPERGQTTLPFASRSTLDDQRLQPLWPQRGDTVRAIADFTDCCKIGTSPATISRKRSPVLPNIVHVSSGMCPNGHEQAFDGAQRQYHLLLRLVSGGQVGLGRLDER